MRSCHLEISNTRNLVQLLLYNWSNFSGKFGEYVPKVLKIYSHLSLSTAFRNLTYRGNQISRGIIKNTQRRGRMPIAMPKYSKCLKY